MSRPFSLSSDEDDIEEEADEESIEANRNLSSDEPSPGIDAQDMVTSAEDHEDANTTADQQSNPKSDDAVLRFRVELEFVQCLAAPFYLHWLAQHEYLEKPQFIEFLKYLQYWQQPKYVQYIEYIDCLVRGHLIAKINHLTQRFLNRLIEDKTFRDNLKYIEFRDQLDREQYNAWREAYHRKNVLHSLLPKEEDEATPETVDYVTFNGMPPPPAFYEEYPQFNREQVERDWYYARPDDFPTQEEVLNLIRNNTEEATTK